METENTLKNNICVDSNNSTKAKSNIEISDKAPQDYVYHYRQKLGEDGYRKACEEHALPKNFEGMEYMEFLSQRRILMAKTVRKAYQRLCE